MGGVGGMFGRETWEDLLQPEPGCKIEDIDVFASHVAVYERTSHGQRLRYFLLTLLTGFMSSVSS